MSRAPKIKIGGRWFSELYPQWDQLLAELSKSIKLETEPQGNQVMPQTQRKYLADNQRFQTFFRDFIKKNPQLNINENQINDIYLYAHDEFFGLGIFRTFLEDPDVEDIIMYSYKHMDVLKNGQKHAYKTPFVNEEDANLWLKRIAEKNNKTLSEKETFLNAQLDDGSRIICMIPPTVPNSAFSLRKHRIERFEPEAYKKSGLAPLVFFDFIEKEVQKRTNILVCGATGSGKTTFLNYLIENVPHNQRIITIEDTKEIMANHPRIQSMIAMAKDSRIQDDSKYNITIKDLVKHSLRMLPDRIVVGETRGPESYDMLDAMNTGHSGSFTTLHADLPRDAVLRLQSMASPANPNIPIWALNDLIGTTIGMIVQLRKVPDSKRRVITEVSQVIHPIQLDDKNMIKDMQEVVENKIYLRPIWKWDNEQKELIQVNEPLQVVSDYIF